MGSATFLLLTIFLLGISILQGAPPRDSSESDSNESTSNSASNSTSDSSSSEDAPPAAAQNEPDQGSASRRTMNPNAAFGYLRHYGYFAGLSQTDAPRSKAMAIARFQRVMGCQVTYNLDPATMEALGAARCGFNDTDVVRSMFINVGRRKRYAAESKWERTALTYSVHSTELSGLDDATTKNTIRAALNVWAAVTPLTFRYVEGSGDIKIVFARRNHGDRIPFDGPGQTLAHAFVPQQLTVYNSWRRQDIEGDVHLDEEERWVQHSRNGISLFLVVAHEIGHSVGLGHSGDRFALMAPRYRYIAGNSPLNNDDIAGIRALYGRNTVDPAPTPPPVLTPNPPTPAPPTTRFPPTRFPPFTRPTPATLPPPAPTRPPPVPGAWDYCRDPRVDAIAAWFAKNFTYAFRDNWYVRLTENGVDARGVRNINDDPLMRNFGLYITRVTAANFFSSGTELRVYASNEEYRFRVSIGTGDLSFIGTRTPLSRDDNLISGMDDMFWHPQFRYFYVFKGPSYSRLRSTSQLYSPPPTNYPQAKSRWGLPADISNGVDAVTHWENNRVYVFKGSQYYRLRENTVGVDGGYPRGIANIWFGCNPNGFGKK